MLLVGGAPALKCDGGFEGDELGGGGNPPGKGPMDPFTNCLLFALNIF